MILQPYEPDHRDACLAIFASNIPDFFTREEAAAFAAFLDDLPGPYFVVRASPGDDPAPGAPATSVDGTRADSGPTGPEILASGGVARETDGRWSLCWIQVAAEAQGQGMGLQLVRELEAWIRKRGEAVQVRLETISRTERFFARLGYTPESRRTDGWSPGVDEVEMVKELTPLSPGTVAPAGLAAGLDGFWQPGVVAELNGQEVKVARIRGTFDWHHHPHADELFWVLGGDLVLEYRDRRVPLSPGEMHVVPAGVEHRPVAREEVHILMMEPAGTLNTGNRRTSYTVDAPERIGVAADSPEPGGPA